MAETIGMLKDNPSLTTSLEIYMEYFETLLNEENAFTANIPPPPPPIADTTTTNS
jgi:hypothetical protein